MYYLKNIIFSDLSKNQKSSLCTFLKSFTKKHSDKNTEDILYAFIEDEEYYFKQGNPHFEWIVPEFEDEKFLNEIKKYINECKKQLELKEAQKPYLEKQKAYAKEQRKKAQEYKQSKEVATKKQLYYYESLCKRYNTQPQNTDGLSKLDLKNMIGKILDDNTKNNINQQIQG